jgi:hypothetical protein
MPADRNIDWDDVIKKEARETNDADFGEVQLTIGDTEDKREKIQALSLAKECYSMKLELLTNTTVVDDAIRFVSQKSQYKETIKSASGKGD